MKLIYPDQLQEIKNKNPDIKLIDVRTPAEYESIRVEYAINIPLDEIIEDNIDKISKVAKKEETLYIICQSGIRSVKACESLMSMGYNDVYSIEGGTILASNVGLPIISC